MVAQPTGGDEVLQPMADERPVVLVRPPCAHSPLDLARERNGAVLPSWQRICRISAELHWSAALAETYSGRRTAGRRVQ